MIKVKNLTFKYSGESDYKALDNLNIHFKPSSYIAILGHNGSGKSTLSKLLVGILTPTEGEIEIDGIIMNQKNMIEIRKRIGIIFQNPDNQFVGSTVEDDIAFGLENKNMSQAEMHEKVQQLAKKVGMLEHLDREPYNLSGGQKQRIAIASTLALDPKIIIFDEVTSMLDPQGKADVISIIKEIQQKRDKTLISITHDMDEAILADQVLVLANGKLVAFGSPKDILKDKKIIDIAKIDSPFIYKLSEQINGIDPTYNEDELVAQICK
ncbi:energy-coupling factor transporter ATPase [Mycoplasma iguanae]|uniref:Energy-coupling factor transporter ATPase n=1 Tax=Mycoplasma iguanae TaxID=292461 RepID=A0ABY5RA08_9MOLU|nr:energy-coupling factor transporter ATPase [Mycoplasma iguanae]UVD81450.1 energy-coupling factor transporter ATPase [Mycoplasma iguanae]